jgi:NitT/TauT family transport system substrate-binding protein
MKKVLMLAAILCAVAAPARTQTVTTVHVTTVPIDAGAEVWYAKDMGFFAKAGLDVEVIPAPNGGAAAASVAGGAVEIGYADTISISSAFGRSVPFTIIAPAAVHVSTAPTTVLVVLPNSPIHTAKDLDNKVIAGSGLGTISGYGPRAWIEKNGGDLSSVKFVELAFPAMQPALEAGRIDAAAIAEPFLTAAKKTDRVLASPYDSVAKTFLVSAYFTTAPWAKDHPDVVNRFASAIHEAAVWANKNHAQSAEILLKYAKIDPSLASEMTRSYYGERLTASLLQPAVDVAAKYSKFTPFAAGDLLYKAPH